MTPTSPTPAAIAAATEIHDRLVSQGLFPQTAVIAQVVTINNMALDIDRHISAIDRAASAGWQDEIPTVPGFYWRHTPGYKPTVRHYSGGALENHTLTSFCRIYKGTKFCGPILMPPLPAAPTPQGGEEDAP